MSAVRTTPLARESPAEQTQERKPYWRQWASWGRDRVSAWGLALGQSWQRMVVARPLVLVAGCFTLGVLLSRQLILDGAGWALLALAVLAMSGVAARAASGTGKMLALLSGCVVAGGVWYLVRTMPAADDIRYLAPAEGRWTWVRLQLEQLHEVPARDEPLRSWQTNAHSTALASAEAVLSNGVWQPCSGTIRLSFDQRVQGLAVGDRLELFGELVAVLPVGNPGEEDSGFADSARGVAARLHVRAYEHHYRLLERGRWYNLLAQIARMQAYLQQRLEERLPADVRGLAQALLLGETSQVEPRSWWRYQRTGIIHILAISGQHLVILCGAVLWAARCWGVTRRRLAWGLMGLVWWYALLTGARPATVRAAVMVTAWCLGLRWARPVEAVNSLALAWLIIGLWNPTDWFDLGCQLSFLSALVLYVVAPGLEVWAREHRDPLERLEPMSISRLLGHGLRSWLRMSLAVSAIIWLVLAPCLAARVHVVAPSSIWLTPLLVPLASTALIGGMVLLLTAGVPGLGDMASFVVSWALRGMDGIVRIGEVTPLAYAHAPGPAGWWLVGFYGVVLAWLLVPGWLSAWRGVWSGLVIWGIFGWLVSLIPQKTQAVQLAFLDVGHGCCVVVECPDGRVWLYDAGSLQGPEVAERIIAPYLWSRGIRKLDAVILSHGDLDHYNGLPRLAEQFRIGEVYVNPSFWEKGGAAVQLVQATLRQHGISVRVLDNSIQALSEGPPAAGAGALPMNGLPLRAGSNPWQAGTSSANAGIFAIEVLHPPPHGPSGPENARSLVVVLHYADHQVLLTGDLEEPGLTQVLPRVRGPVEILWAPHHGSPRSNTAAWADACRPGLVIIGCGRRDRPNRAVYQAIGATVWETWREGAVLITMDRQGVRATTYRTRRLWAR